LSHWISVKVHFFFWTIFFSGTVFFEFLLLVPQKIRLSFDLIRFLGFWFYLLFNPDFCSVGFNLFKSSTVTPYCLAIP
jgi:hypothetical protein